MTTARLFQMSDTCDLATSSLAMSPRVLDRRRAPRGSGKSATGLPSLEVQDQRLTVAAGSSTGKLTSHLTTGRSTVP
jgi:hypothetical protein